MIAHGHRIKFSFGCLGIFRTNFTMQFGTVRKPNPTAGLVLKLLDRSFRIPHRHGGEQAGVR